MTATLAQQHLQLALRRVRARVMRHMRRYAERLLQVDGSYSDRCVGPHELRRLIGRPAPEQGQRWLDHHGVPALDDLEAQLADLRQRDEAFTDALTEAQREALPLRRVAGRFGLSPAALDLLIAAAAPRLDEDLLRLMTVAWSDFTRRQPSAAFLLEVLEGEDQPRAVLLGLLSDHSPLLRHRLLWAGEDEAWAPHTPRLYAPLVVPQRVLDALLDAPPLLPAGCALCPAPLPLARLRVEARTLQHLRQQLARGPRPRLCLLGPASAGRRTAASALTHSLYKMPLLEVHLERALSPAAPALTTLAEIAREALLLGAGLLLRCEELTEAVSGRAALLAHLPAAQALLADLPAPVFLTMNHLDRGLRALLPDAAEVTISAPDVEQQLDLWVEALEGVMPGGEAAHVAQDLARSYRLPAGVVFHAVARARSRQAADPDAAPDAPLAAHHLLDAVRGQLDHRLGALADLVTTSVSLDDVVLPPKIRRQLDEILGFARNARRVLRDWGFAARSPYGNALSVMFSGPPGTGKTLVAGALARSLRRVLYRVDLSRVVDKYIGETEKNLGRVFDEASRAQAVLLFDEADSLFAKRTEVKSSNDRYANLEVNYLLQRLEAYEGVSILTTNFEASIDEAFLRRVRFKLAFPMPEAAERADLWRKLMPPAAPLSPDIDWEDLGALFEMTGGHIRNAVLRAAIQAAGRDGAICHADLLRAGAAEAREAGALVRGHLDLDDEDDAG
jgi:AAA+ superfamily predicted ATPase